jgi:PAS domain S-box-containing protein
LENTSDSAFYKTIVETSNEGVWVVDVNYVTQFVNPKMASILGYDRDQILGKKLTDFLPAHTTFDPNHHFQSEKAEILEIEFINSAKKSIFVRLNASPFFKDGTLVNITAMVLLFLFGMKISQKSNKQSMS